MNSKELEIIKILARADKPLALPEILSAQPTLAKSTVAAALARLVKSEMIEVGGIGRSGKVICRAFRPTKRAYKRILQSIIDSFNGVSDIISKTDLFAALLRTNKDPIKAREEIRQLRDMLDKYEKEIGLDNPDS